MKKLLFFLAACAVSLSTFAASITAYDVTFDSQSIAGQVEVTDSKTIIVSWSGIQDWESIHAQFTEQPTANCGFSVTPDYITTTEYISGVQTSIYSGEYTISYTATAAGNFKGKLRFWTNDENGNPTIMKDINVSVEVTNDVHIPNIYPCQRVNNIQEGDVIAFVYEAGGAVGGLHSGTYLPSVTDDVTIDKDNGTAMIPETAQFLTASRDNGYWKLTSSDSKLLGANGDELKLGDGTVTLWSIEFDDNDALVSPKDESTKIQFNTQAPRFKLYNQDNGSIQIYRQAGPPQPLVSNVELAQALNLGNLALSATRQIQVKYTATQLTNDIDWEITGTDKTHFDLSVSGDKKSGTITITYKGTKTTAGTIDAELYFMTQDNEYNLYDGSFPISLNLIKLDGIAFSRSSFSALINTSLDLSQELTFSPSTVPSTGRQVTWKIENSYSGAATITDAGVFSATTSRTYTVIATSTIGDNITASCDIVVSLPAATSIDLSKTDTTMHKGEKFTLTAKVIPTGADQAVTYSSSDTNIASFKSNGEITAKGYGDATITVTANSDVNIKATCTVHVVPWAVESVEFDPDVITVYTGTKVKLEPTILPAKAIDENDVTFESNDNNTAPIVDSCYVRGDQVGSATITVTAGTKTATLQVNVVNPPYFTKVTTPAILQEKDTIILAADLGGGSTVIAGARDNKKLTVITDGLVDDPYAYAVDAQRFVIGTISGKTGYTLARPNATKVLAESGNDLYEENTTTSKNIMWEFVEDGTNGVYVHNLGNTNAYFKYLNNAIKPYKATSEGAVYVYVYRRPYKEPTAVENIEAEAVPAQKLLHEGRIVILRDGVMYELDGRRTK